MPNKSNTNKNSTDSNGVITPSTAFLTLIALIAVFCFWRSHSKSDNMSRPLTKSSEKAAVNEFRDITGANATEATKWLKKYKFNTNSAINAYFNEGGSTGGGSKAKESQKKVGEIWERFKDPSNPKLITIDGTMSLCEELGIDPSSDSVLFCLASDLGSKATGEWEKEPFVQGWQAIDSGIDSIAKMKAALPDLRRKLVQDPVYFKKVYMHTFDLCKAPGARVLALDTAIDMWNLFIPPALESSPSALARAPADNPTASATTTPSAFQKPELEMWLDFQREKGKAVSKDTWSLFIDFIRTIDADFKEYDEEAAWPSTIDDFVEYVRTKRA